MAENRAEQTKGQLEETRFQIKRLSDDIAKKEKDFNELNNIRQQLTLQIEQGKIRQENLKKQTQNLSDQWTAKEILAAALIKEVNQVQIEITNKKTQRREEENKQKRQRDEYRQTHTYYHRNFNKN